MASVKSVCIEFGCLTLLPHHELVKISCGVVDDKFHLGACMSISTAFATHFTL